MQIQFTSEDDDIPPNSNYPSDDERSPTPGVPSRVPLPYPPLYNDEFRGLAYRSRPVESQSMATVHCFPGQPRCVHVPETHDKKFVEAINKPEIITREAACCGSEQTMVGQKTHVDCCSYCCCYYHPPAFESTGQFKAMVRGGRGQELRLREGGCTTVRSLVKCGGVRLALPMACDVLLELVRTAMEVAQSVRKELLVGVPVRMHPLSNSLTPFRKILIGTKSTSTSIRRTSTMVLNTPAPSAVPSS